MAKLAMVTLLNTVVVTSSLTKEKLEAVSKFNPRALSLYTKVEGDYEEVLYSIGLGNGAIGNFQTMFKESESKLVATSEVKPQGTKKLIEIIREDLVGPMTYINKIEEQVEAAYTEIEASLNSFEAEIEEINL